MLQQRGFTPYAYDPTQTARLLADAGWSKGADGIYQRNGQRFQLDTAALARSNAQEATALAGQWTQLGFVSTPSFINANATNANELESTFQGVITWPGTFRDGAVREWTSEQISTPETRWRGSNFGGYSNPRIDELSARFQVALQPSEQQQLLADALKVAHDDLPFISSYIYMIPLMFRKGVTGPGKVSPNQLASAWNMHTWEIN
jgi:peptide/nickel transport system substrate-binding protein